MPTRMQKMYAAKKVVVVVVFFFTMLFMKEVMDTILPPPGRGDFQDRPKRRESKVTAPERVKNRVLVKPDAILDIEAVAEEEEQGPVVMDQGEEGEEVNVANVRGAGEGPVIVNGVTAEDEDKVLEDPRQLDEEERQNAAAAQQGIEEPEGMQAPDLGTGGNLKVPNQDMAPMVQQGSIRRPNLQMARMVVPMNQDTAGSAENPPSFGPNYYTVYVNKNTKLESVQVILSGELLQFRIKACSDAYLIYRQKNVVDEFSYHIGFGYGKKTVLWKQPPDPVTKEYDTPEEGYLGCDKFTSYWVRRAGPSFQIGLENGGGPFIDWKDPKPFAIGGISLATPHPKQTAVWQLDIRSVQTLRVDTGDEYSYEQAWISTVGKESLVLQVKACRDAHVLLSDQEGEVGNVYEVAIGMGDNAKTAIREDKFGPNMVTEDTPDIMDCGDTKAFWFTWTNSKLTVGRGTRPGSRILLSYGKENHPEEIRSVAMSTGWGATGKWLFNMDEDHLYPS